MHSHPHKHEVRTQLDVVQALHDESRHFLFGNTLEACPEADLVSCGEVTIQEVVLRTHCRLVSGVCGVVG